MIIDKPMNRDLSKWLEETMTQIDERVIELKEHVLEGDEEHGN
jgi:hypothetical protein